MAAVRVFPLALLERAYGSVRVEEAAAPPTKLARPAMSLDQYLALRRELYGRPSSSDDDEQEPVTQRYGA